VGDGLAEAGAGSEHGDGRGQGGRSLAISWGQVDAIVSPRLRGRQMTAAA
jgi:hypothetical protein